MEMLAVDDLIADPLIGGADHLDQERVTRYSTILDQMPPVVFRTPEGLLLADGYHRVAAAKLSGAAAIAADVRDGSRRDALRFAVLLGAEEPGLSEAEVLARILRRGGGQPGRQC